jgi:hypothetical protein
VALRLIYMMFTRVLGWAIETVSQCAMLGMDEQGYGFFQVVVTARRA